MAVYVHAAFEWIFFIGPIQYVFFITLGLIASLAYQLGYFKPKGTQNSQVALGNAENFGPQVSNRQS